MMDRLAEIEVRAQGAVPGPWTVEPSYLSCHDGRGHPKAGFCISEAETVGDSECGYYERETAEFIAHAREDIPYLLAQLHEARGHAVALESEVARLRHYEAALTELGLGLDWHETGVIGV